MLDTRTLWELIERRADETPDARMAIDESGTQITFAGYRDACGSMAAGLAAHEVTEGTVVSWELPTRIESLVLVGALARLGAVQNPIIPIYRDREVGFIARQARPRLLIVPGEFRGFDYPAMARGIASEVGGLEVLVAEEGLPRADAASLPAFAPSDGVRWLFYTSGTTADPKGAQHTDATVMAPARGMCERLELRAEDRNALVFPFTHIGGIIWLCSGLMSGLTQLVVETFNPPATIPFLREHGVTVAGAGTPFHMAYVTAQREQPDEPLFPEVRVFPGGGAPKPPQLHRDIKAEMGGAGIVSGYGLTEAPILTMGSLHDSDGELANSEGRPLPGVELRLVTVEGKPAGAGEQGEIRAKAPQVMKGYLDATLDAEAFDADGWFRTGDLGRLDPDGNVIITGRLKDIIIRKGENVSAKEVEDALFDHPSVQDIAVVGLPDPERGEVVCAVVVGELGFDDMVQHLKSKGLATYKLPERLETVEALPRNPTGKVLKFELRDRFAGP